MASTTDVEAQNVGAQRTASGSEASSASFEKQNDQSKKKKAAFLVLPGKNYGSRLKASTKRWWWAWFLILAAVVLVITLPVVYVAYPKMAQSGLDGADVSIDGMKVYSATQNSFGLELNTTIKSHVSEKPTFDGFSASLYLEDEPGHRPFAYVEFPTVKSSSSTPVKINQTVQITDDTRDAFIRYNEVVLQNETYRVTTYGKTKIHYLAFPVDTVTFDHIVEQNGFNKFQGLYTDNLTVSLTGDENGNNFFADVHIPNPSQLTVNLGNATFDNYFNGSMFGSSYIDNMVLAPGNNTFRLRATNDQGPILDAVQHPPYCQTGLIPVEIRAKTVMDGTEEIDYFQEAMKSVPIYQDLDIAGAIQKLTGIRPQCSNTTSS